MLKKIGSLTGALIACACLSANASTALAAEKGRYAAAKKELPEDLYPMYRILERLMQTNKVNEAISITVRSTSPEECAAMTGNKELCAVIGDLPDVKQKDSMLTWAIQVVSANNAHPNASATGRNNLIRMQKSLINGFGGSPAAIACVVGHELAHLTEKHSKKTSIKMNELDIASSERIASAIENAKRAQKGQQLWTALAMGLNAAAGTWQGAASNQQLAASVEADSAEGTAVLRSFMKANYATLRSNAPRSLASMESLQGLGAKLIKRTKVDIDAYLDQHSRELYSFSRAQELEADAKGVEYVARAGIDPEKCLEVVDLLHRNTGDKGTSAYATHPGEEERREKMKLAIQSLPPAVRDQYKMQQIKRPILPYVYDRDTQVVRISPVGTTGMKAGSNQKSSSIEMLLGN